MGIHKVAVVIINGTWTPVRLELH